MTGKELFREIGNISEEYVAEAERYRKQTTGVRRLVKNPVFRKTFATAACLVVCAGLVFSVQKLGVSHDTAKESAMDYDGAVAEMAPAESPVAESSATQSVAPGSEEKAEGALETRPETEASIVSEAAEEELKEESFQQKEEFSQEGASIKEQGENIGNNQTGSVGKNDEITELQKSDAIWDAELAKEKMASYPNKYEDILKLDGVYILVHGEAKKGQEIWDAFVKSVDTGEIAQAEIIRFTVEGDPIIETVYYDGKVFYLCVDKSRDAYRGSGDAYFEAQYSSLVKEETMLEGGGNSIEYYLKEGDKEYSIVYFVK